MDFADAHVTAAQPPPAAALTLEGVFRAARSNDALAQTNAKKYQIVGESPQANAEKKIAVFTRRLCELQSKSSATEISPGGLVIVWSDVATPNCSFKVKVLALPPNQCVIFLDRLLLWASAPPRHISPQNPALDMSATCPLVVTCMFPLAGTCPGSGLAALLFGLEPAA